MRAVLALHMTPAQEQDRANVKTLVEQVQALTRESVKVAFVDQGYTGEQPARMPRSIGSNWKL